MADEIIGRISVGDGATFTPSVNSAGELSWTNNKNLPNPETVDIAQAVVDAGSLDSRYLQLSGGTMSGWLSANVNEFRIRNSKSAHDGVVSVVGGEGTTTGANLYLYGVSHSSQAGRFFLSATDGANTKSLRGQADGTLTWAGNDVITSAGGTMDVVTLSGWPAIKRANTGSAVVICGGDSTGGDAGSKLYLYGATQSSNPGEFLLYAGKSGANSGLVGKPDGTLTWGGRRIAFEYLGSASTGVATNFTLPSTGWWLVVCGHNSTPGLNGIFAVRTGGNMAFKLAGAGNITMTCSGTTITVTPSSGATQVACLQIPAS